MRKMNDSQTVINGITRSVYWPVSEDVEIESHNYKIETLSIFENVSLWTFELPYWHPDNDVSVYFPSGYHLVLNKKLLRVSSLPNSI